MEIREVCSKSDLRSFVRTPRELYQSFAGYRASIEGPELYSLTLPLVPGSVGERAFFLALDDGSVAGRIGVSYDSNSQEHFGQGVGFFSHFDCVDNFEVAKALMESASGWLRQRGLVRVIGPMTPRVTDPRGVLLDSESESPYGLSWSPAYLSRFCEALGLQKAQDLYDYKVALSPKTFDRLTPFADRVSRKLPNLTWRSLNRDAVHLDIAQFAELYNAAWKANWGFLPISPEQLGMAVEPLLPVLTDDLVMIANNGEQMVAFQLILPDLTAAVRMDETGEPVVDPALIPSIGVYRGVFVGVHPEYRHQGLDLLMLHRGLQVLRSRGVSVMHVGWVLESNRLWGSQIERIAGAVNAKKRRYRIYEGPLC